MTGLRIFGLGLGLFILVACASTPPTPEYESVYVNEVKLTLPTSVVPDHVLNVVANVSRAAGEDAVIITSGSRTPRKQVEVMIEYYLECPHNPACGVDYFLRTYEPACLGRMLEVYEPIAPLNAARREAVLTAMTAEVAGAIARLDAGPQARTCMAHVRAPGKYAVDIAPSSVTNWLSYYRALKAVPDTIIIQERVFHPEIDGAPPSPVPDAAFHVEIRDPVSPLPRADRRQTPYVTGL